MKALCDACNRIVDVSPLRPLASAHSATFFELAPHGCSADGNLISGWISGDHVIQRRRPSARRARERLRGRR